MIDTTIFAVDFFARRSGLGLDEVISSYLQSTAAFLSIRPLSEVKRS
jgi:hypothetical protein